MTYQVKALTTGENTRAELNDIFDPIIQETLNNSQTYAGKVKKVKNYSDYARFRARTGRNASADSYEESDTIVTGDVTRARVSTAIKLLKVGVEVSGLMMESAKGAGGIGDVWAEETRDSTEDFINELDTQLLTGTGTGSDLFGLIYLVDDGTNYANLYSTARATNNWVKSGYDATSEALSIDRMRAMQEDVKTEGAQINNLMYLTTYEGVNSYKNLLQNLQRLVPTSGRAGFEGMPELDGIPIFDDQHTTDGYLYLLDMSTFELRTLLDATMRELPSGKDARAAFIKMYAEHISKAPCRSFKKTGLTDA